MLGLLSALLLLVLLAFGAQQWTVRAHWHASAGIEAPAGVTATPAADLAAPSPGSPQTHPDCVWCHAALHAAAVAPPPAWAGLPSVPNRFLFLPRTDRIAAFLAPISWAWHSRGPPAA